MNSAEFKSAMDEVDVDEYVNPKLIEQVMSNLLSNTRVKKHLRQTIIEVLDDMGIRDENDISLRKLG